MQKAPSQGLSSPRGVEARSKANGIDSATGLSQHATGAPHMARSAKGSECGGWRFAIVHRKYRRSMGLAR